MELEPVTIDQLLHLIGEREVQLFQLRRALAATQAELAAIKAAVITATRPVDRDPPP